MNVSSVFITFCLLTPVDQLIPYSSCVMHLNIHTNTEHTHNSPHKSNARNLSDHKWLVTLSARFNFGDGKRMRCIIIMNWWMDEASGRPTVYSVFSSWWISNVLILVASRGEWLPNRIETHIPNTLQIEHFTFSGQHTISLFFLFWCCCGGGCGGNGAVCLTQKEQTQIMLLILTTPISRDDDFVHFHNETFGERASARARANEFQ